MSATDTSSRIDRSAAQVATHTPQGHRRAGVVDLLGRRAVHVRQGTSTARMMSATRMSAAKGQAVPAHGAPLAGHDAGPPQVGQDVLQELGGDALPPGERRPSWAWRGVAASSTAARTA